jgi:hypothetical protein
MQKVLFISDGSPFNFNYSGASSFKTSHLALLNEIPNLCIYIVCLSPVEPGPIEIPDINHARVIRIHANFETSPKPLPIYKSLLKAFSQPGRFSFYPLLFPSISRRNIAIIQNIVNDIKPEIIWAEHLEPFLLISFLRHFKGKMIYSHHDFSGKLIVIRRQNMKDYIRSFLIQVIQKNLIRKNGDYVVGGAQNELEEIIKISKSTATLYLPTLYPVVPVLFSKNMQWNKPLRIIHFGSPQATANQIGLKNLLTHIIPHLHDKIDYECFIIGDVDLNNPEIKGLLNQPKVFCKGYVADLSSVLRPLDIHILPYDRPTGSRTRYPVAINHGQVLIGHSASLAGTQGLVHQENCLMKNSFPEIVMLLIWLSNKPQERLRLASNAKKWYDKTHTRHYQAEILKTWLVKNNLINDK